MSPGKVLQPAVKMKVDELFLCWLSQPATQLTLKDWLRRIKNKEKTEFGNTDSGNSKNESFTSKDSSSKQCILGDTRLPLMSFSPPQLSTTLPLATPASSRNTSNVRATRRSLRTKESSYKWQDASEKFVSGSFSIAKASIDVVHTRLDRKFLSNTIARAACKLCKYFKMFRVQTKKEETLPPSHSQNIPTFYFPRGCPKEKVNIDAVIAKIEKTFSEFPNERATLEDMGKVAKDVVNSHPGLSFLKEASEFHSRYITTVIQRIFYTVNRSWSGKITCNELRKSNFLQNVALLEEEADINQLTEYFSYEHFYVIYCKFWELDTDHDLYIDRKDLARHNDYAISNRMIERIFSGAVTRGRKAQKDGKISYADFVWFLISEEDKKTPTSIEYWFRCMDLDGDGALSMYELEYFYEEQCQKLVNMDIEPLPFEDCLCQMLDLVKPQHEGKITLHDLKRCKLTNVFFDTFFNLDKYLEHEQKDQYSMLRDGEGESQEVSDWEKYAAGEYDILVAEEAASDQWNDGYEAELNPVNHQKASVLKYQMEKRPFFEMPSHLADVNLDDYDYDEDFE
ncbi:hypothetical protein DUI87_16153 [Hirundo rustica rustica]|uniref:EF-hand domain-containing protein n=1 Tax=Hirundo rustica rustica TaxID=333673 RepID=A0A3M0K6M2_HIRRU|nr:hypothetical protein DUI87_16153 [Hirundo rustica rustica]